MNTTTTAQPARRAQARAADRDQTRLVVLSAAGYVGSWLLGLAVAPSAPRAGAGAAEVGDHFTQHGGAVLLSSALVHGTAALFLGGFAVGLVRAVGVRGRLRRAVLATGLVAAGLSLVQVALEVLAVTADQDRTVLRLFEANTVVDVIKIAVLAALVAVGTTAVGRAGAAPRWLRALAALLVPLLPVGSAGLVVDSGPLYGALATSLVLLLVWVGATAAVLGRHARLTGS